MMGLPGQGQVVQGVNGGQRFRFENLFQEDGGLTLESSTSGSLDDSGAGTGAGVGMGTSTMGGMSGMSGVSGVSTMGGPGGPGPIGGTVVMGEEDETAKKKVYAGFLLSCLGKILIFQFVSRRGRFTFLNSMSV